MNLSHFGDRCPDSELESSIIADFSPVQQERASTILLVLHRLTYHTGLSDNARVVLGNRGQGFFLNEATRELEKALRAFFNSATRDESACFTGILLSHGASIGPKGRDLRGRSTRSLNFRKGCIIFD